MTRPVPPSRRPSRNALGLAAGLALAVPAGAQAAGGIAAPAGATELLAEFLAICPAAVSDVSASVRLASASGWASALGESEMAVLGRAAFGGANLVKTVDGAETQLTIVRRDFPDLATTSCEMAVLQGDVALDTALLAQVDGMRGGPSLVEGENAGLWSYRDDDGVPVAVLTARWSGQGARLAMEKSVPRAAAGGAP